MRDEPGPVEPEYTPAGPDAENMASPDNPPPTSAQPYKGDERTDGDDALKDPELREELGEHITGMGTDT
jgi:hypothetical protein